MLLAKELTMRLLEPTISCVLVMLACAAPVGQTPDQCPPPQGEFPPTDCAVVRGIARMPDGQPLVVKPIRADSFIPSLAYVYSSKTAITTGDGSFTIVVNRINRLKPRTSPDTATVELKTYASQDPKAGETPAARASVLMYFAELGAPVTATVVTLHFVPYDK
jgi:hypothetical protein